MPLGIWVIRTLDSVGNKISTAYLFLRRIFLETIFITTFLYVSIYGSIFDLESAYSSLILFSIGYLILTCIYEIFYVLNDVVFVRREDKPSIRRYVYNISMCRVIVVRLIYIIVLVYLLLVYFQVSFTNICIAISLLTLTLAIHNLQTIKLKRIYTFSVLRLARWFFIPISILGPSKASCIFVPLIPYFVIELIKGYNYELSKYGIQVPRIAIRESYVYAIFLPLQIVSLYPNTLLLLGNIIVMLITFIIETLKLKTKIKRFVLERCNK